MAEQASARPPTQGEGLPGADVPLADGLSIINAIREYKKEATDSRRLREQLNKRNQDAYLGRQDWSHKRAGQSKEFLPKIPVAVEQFVAFAKRALTQFGPWYDPVVGLDSKSPLAGEQIRALLDSFLDHLVIDDNEMGTLPLLFTDGLKTGSLDGLMIFKVHGVRRNERKFFTEPGEPLVTEDGFIEEGEDQLKAEMTKAWRLRIDLVRWEDYLKDPSGHGLYEVHTTERDLHYIEERAEEGIYDQDAVALLKENMRRKREEERRPESRGHMTSDPPSFRAKVVIDEFWGTILDGEGHVAHENVLITVANDKYILRGPVPNPFWHQESPFVEAPLIRVPFSVWHKALFDHAADLNLTLNEMFNLMIDGAMSSVWGIKQLRIEDLENPEEVSDGIPQGMTLSVKSSLPHGMKVLEKIAEGEVPRDAMLVFEALNREFTAAALSNELKMGSLPPKQVRATEVIEMSQSQAITLDSIVADLERILSSVLRKAFLTIMQNMDDILASDIIGAIGQDAAFRLARMSPAERFATFSSSANFNVHGLSALMSKVKDFQKMMALLQAVVSNPILLQAFFKKYSGDKILAHLMKSLSINPVQMERDEQELARLDQDIKELPAFQSLLQGGQQQAGQGGPGGESLPAEINAAGNASSGLAGAGGS
jgi:hypothetical protein